MAAPAAADHRYNHVLGENDGRSPAAATANAGNFSTTADATSSNDSRLARTGSSLIVPLAEIATVLIGGGALLVLATRRRSERAATS